MSSRTRRIVLWISAPVVIFAIAGGFLSKVAAREDTYPQLRIFHEVVSFIVGNYVEAVDVDKVMLGAMHGLADSLDPDSAYLTAEQVKQLEANAPLPAGEIGVDITRQYYLRVVAVRDGSPAAKAGLRTGDYLRAIGGVPTREMSVFEGVHRLHGAPGAKVSVTVIRGNASDPHAIDVAFEAPNAPDVSGRLAAPGVGYVRVAALGKRAVDQARSEIADLTKNGATSLIVDVRRNSGGSLDTGLALARLFVKDGTLAVRESKGAQPEKIVANPGDGAIALPLTILIDNGTSSGAELFASAVAGNKRAELVGEHTIGRAAQQQLTKLPDGSGLWLTTMRYLTPDGKPLHEKGLEPTVGVEEPDVEFGQTPPPGDPILDKALERLTQKNAA